MIFRHYGAPLTFTETMAVLGPKPGPVAPTPTTPPSTPPVTGSLPIVVKPPAPVITPVLPPPSTLPPPPMPKPPEKQDGMMWIIGGMGVLALVIFLARKK